MRKIRAFCILLAVLLLQPVCAFGAEGLGGDPIYSWAYDAAGFASAKERGLDGEGVVIAIIDSGLDIEHEDLRNIKISPWSRNFLGNGSGEDLWQRDQKGHGSFVASLIAAETGNGKGIASPAPRAELMILRVVSANSRRFQKNNQYDSGSGTVAAVSEAIRYAADHGAQVINISMGGASLDVQVLQEAVDYAADKGAIIVSATGNDGGSRIYYPAGCERVIGVSAVDSDGRIWGRSEHNDSTDAAAPGADIMGIQIYPGGVSYKPENQKSTYQKGSGTSYAVPLVSVLAAFAKEVNPAIGYDGFADLLEESCFDAGDPGKDPYYGFGIIDCAAMMKSLFDVERLVFLDTDQSPVEGLPQGFTLAKGCGKELPIATRPGYLFRGWYLDPQLTQKAPESFLLNRTEITKLYASWEPVPLHLTKEQQDALMKAYGPLQVFRFEHDLIRKINENR